MAFDEDRGVAVCDFFGCWNGVPVPPGRDFPEYVAEHPDWHWHEGKRLVRCPEHPFSDKLWLT